MYRFISRSFQITASLFVLLISVTIASAQTSNGVIAGAITDSTGAGISGARVTAVGLQTGQSRSVRTNSAGGFRIESVLLDTYTITVEATGFAKHSTSNVRVNASIVTSVNSVLVVGGVSDSVQVEASSELIQTDSGEISATLGTQAIGNLPIDGLSPYELATTLPGVAQPPTDYQNAAGFPNGFQFSVNGTRPRSNNFLIEGQDNNDQAVHGQAFTPENPEAYNDVTFLLNSYGAEFGHGGGSVSNLILKTGTNTFHGAVWNRLENSSLDAMDKGDLLNGSTIKSKYRENIAGFSIGGPAIKDKLFFFASYQFDHYRATANLNPIIIPTAAGVATLQSLPTNPRIAAYLQAIGSLRAPATVSSLALGSTPGTTVNRGSLAVGPFRRNLKNATDVSELDIKGDYVISSKDTFQIHYIRSPSFAPYNTANAVLPGFDTEIDAVAHNAGIAVTHTFTPTLINEFRFSYGRIQDVFALRPETLANPLAASPTTTIGIAAGAIAGTTGEVTAFGSPAGFPQGRFHNTYQIQDAVTWSKGRHNIKAGFDLPIIQVRDQVGLNLNGSLVYGAGTTASGYSAFADYIDDFGGSGGSISQQFGNPTVRPMFYLQNYFAQDSWKFSPSLTLELGLRYEYSGTPFNVIKYPGVTPDSVTNFQAAIPQQADAADWAPRFGFAYAPRLFGEKKTVIRGGFGIFYDGPFTSLIDNFSSFAPNAAAPRLSSTTATSRPRGTTGLSTLFPTLNRTPLATNTAEYITPHLLAPRILHWNLNVERELPGSFTAQIGYVGTRGEHLYASTEFNQFINNTTGSTARRISTRGDIIRFDNTADSIYHSLQAQLVRKYRHGFLFRAAYTFGRAEDDSSEVSVAGQFSANASLQYPNARKNTDYGLSSFDHRQRLVFSYVYEIPKWGNAPRLIGEIVNGWQVSGVSQFQTGNPYNVEIGTEWNGDGITNDRPEVGNPNAPLATFAVHGDDVNLGFTAPAGTYCDGAYANYTSDPCHQVPLSSVHWVLPYYGTRGNAVGRNSVILRGFERWDFSAQKSFKTWKEQSFDIRAEMFNVFNHGNTGTPNFDLTTGFANPTNSSTVTTFNNYALTVSGHRSIRMYLRYKF